LRERKKDERKLRKLMYELGLTLIQIHALVSANFFPPPFFPSNQTEPKRENAKILAYKKEIVEERVIF
jgi:hypothetical protein